jgi:polyisoprenoid-binding protein YceI
MKTSNLIGLFACISLLSLSTVHSQSLKMAGSSKVWIDGTSTLHDWKCDAKGIFGNFSIPEDVFGSKVGEDIDIKAYIQIPVNKIWNKEEKLVENLREALEDDKFSSIKYTVIKATVISSDANNAKVRTNGKLAIHGNEKTVTIDVQLAKQASGMEAKGSYSLKMKDYDVDPPTMFLGTIKTGNEIKISFELDLTK